MRTDYITCVSVVVAAAGFIVAAANCAPANARSSQPTHRVLDETVAPAGGLKLRAVNLVRETVTPNEAEFTRTAGTRNPTRRHVNTKRRSRKHTNNVRTPSKIRPAPKINYANETNPAGSNQSSNTFTVETSTDLQTWD